MEDSARELKLEDLVRISEEADAALKESVARHLEEKYSLPVVWTGRISSPGEASYRLFFRTGEEPEIPFKVEIGEEEEFLDDYVRNRALYPLRAGLEEAVPGSAVSLAIPEDSRKPEEDRDISLREYLKKRKITRILARILVKKDGGAGKEAVLRALEDASAHYGADLACGVWYLDEERFEAGKQMFRSFPTVSGDIIEDLEPEAGFSVYVVDGTAQNIKDFEFEYPEVKQDGGD